MSEAELNGAQGMDSPVHLRKWDERNSTDERQRTSKVIATNFALLLLRTDYTLLYRIPDAMAGEDGHLAGTYYSTHRQIGPQLNHLVATYTLIYSFLTERSHTKAAEAVKKAAKEIVVLKDGMKPDGPSLPEILKQWKAQKKEDDSSSS